MKKTKLFFSCIILCLSNLLFSQEILSNQNYNWSNVLSGKIIAEPIVTSYGVCVISDAKTLSAISNTGKVLWEKNIGRTTNPKLGVFEEDFIFLVNNSKKLVLFNPSGSEIWNKTLDFEIKDAPFPGRDGRFFVRGKNQINCYGMNGICKWELKTPEQSDLSLQELPDGSFLVFMKKLSEGKTQGLRCSPFGTILEEITFAGEVINSSWSNAGIFLNFSDGTTGLFSLENDLAKNKWVFNSPENSIKPLQNYTIPSKNREQAAIFSQNGSTLQTYIINPENGTILSSFKIPELSFITKAEFNNFGIFITDSTKAVFYNTKGSCLWSAVLPSKTSKLKWNYLTYTNDNFLLIFGTNWTLNAYRVTQNANEKKSITRKTNYSDYYDISTQSFDTIYTVNLDSNLISQSRYDNLSKGYYGDKEILWSSELQSTCIEYFNYLNSSNSGGRVDKSVFQNDTSGLEKMISQFNLYGSDTFNTYTITILKKEKNRSLINTALNNIIKFGYDPDGKLLQSLENLTVTASKKDEMMLINICESVYSICKFMGRPAYNSKGKNILTTLLYPQYSSQTRNYARDTLKKIASLDL